MCTDGLDCREQPVSDEPRGPRVRVVLPTRMELGPLLNLSWANALHTVVLDGSDVCLCGTRHELDAGDDLQVFVECAPSSNEPGPLRVCLLWAKEEDPGVAWVPLEDFPHEWYRAVTHLLGGIFGEGLLCYDFGTLRAVLDRKPQLTYRRGAGASMQAAYERLESKLPPTSARACHFAVLMPPDGTLKDLSAVLQQLERRFPDECDVWGYANVEEHVPIEVSVLLAG